MQWEQLTSSDFVKAVEASQGVGIIPVGVIESHASHLPLGTDLYTAHYAAVTAAAEEPAIVFPQYPYTINHESAHLPGALVIKRELAFALLENICDEMYRNGIDKIIIISGHGGNRYFIPLFVQTLPEKRKPYLVYFINPPMPEDEKILDHPENGHACEGETSMIRFINDDLVKMDQIPPKPFTNLLRNKEIQAAGGYNQVDWYAMYPHMYVGDAHLATAEKGEKIMTHMAQSLVKAIRAIKADTVSPELLKEFNALHAKPAAPDFWTEE